VLLKIERITDLYAAVVIATLFLPMLAELRT